jgi:hypothetical protein
MYLYQNSDNPILKARLLVLCMLLGCVRIQAQNDEHWALGLSGIYDFQTNGIGFGARAYIPLTERLAVSPQFAYFPPFNAIHEIYAGVSAQFKVLYIRNWHVYALAAGYYNRWLNYTNFDSKIARSNNIAGEFGVGIMKTIACIHPFAELRYDQKWKEAHLQIGFLISFGDCYSAPHLCPAYSKRKHTIPDPV